MTTPIPSHRKQVAAPVEAITYTTDAVPARQASVLKEPAPESPEKKAAEKPGKKSR